VERLSEREKERIRELLADGAPVWLIHQEIAQSRFKIRRYINSLERPATRRARRLPPGRGRTHRGADQRRVRAGREATQRRPDRPLSAPDPAGAVPPACPKQRETAVNGGYSR
jgi:hypothetical protein